MHDWNDSRFLLLMLGTDVVEAAGAKLLELWERRSRPGRLQRALRDLESVGLIHRTGEGKVDERLFRLTAAGRRALNGPIDPEALWSRVWDGQWRLVLFDVPQSQSVLRDRLRRRLKEMRCGWLQNSVWLTPDPLEEIGRQLAEERMSVESLVFLEARPAGGESDADLVAGAWDFDAVAESHSAYLRLTGLRPSRDRRGQPSAWESWAQAEHQAWRQVVRVDPFLPERLWPEGYAGRAVWKARTESIRVATEAFGRMLGAP